jgi:hypothetical protein
MRSRLSQYAPGYSLTPNGAFATPPIATTVIDKRKGGHSGHNSGFLV